jgi:hypothetical protein
MAAVASGQLSTVDSATAEPGGDINAEVVVPAAEKLDRDQIRNLVGAKNVMGTCSG